MNISEDERKILSVIEQMTKENGYPPTIREIARAISRGSTTVHYHITMLVRDGHMAKQDGISRSYKVIRREPEATEVPAPCAG